MLLVSTIKSLCKDASHGKSPSLIRKKRYIHDYLYMSNLYWVLFLKPSLTRFNLSKPEEVRGKNKYFAKAYIAPNKLFNERKVKETLAIL